MGDGHLRIPLSRQPRIGWPTRRDVVRSKAHADGCPDRRLLNLFQCRRAGAIGSPHNCETHSVSCGRRDRVVTVNPVREIHSAQQEDQQDHYR